jgi:hypothetical protein
MAITAVRQVRPGAIETAAQEAFLVAYRAGGVAVEADNGRA